MTNVSFDDACHALLSLNEEETEELSKFKCLELFNGMTFNYFKSFLKQDPLHDLVCKENLNLVKEAISKKHCNFFGVGICLKGRNLENLINYMAMEFYKTKGSGGDYSQEYMFLERKICVACADYMLPYIEFFEKTGRFAPKTDGAVAYHVKMNLEEETIQDIFSSIFGRNVKIIRF